MDQLAKNKPADVNSILENIGRAASKASSHPAPSSRRNSIFSSGVPSKYSSSEARTRAQLSNESLLRAQAKRISDAARVQFEATRTGPFGTPMMSGGNGGRIPPRSSSAQADPDDPNDSDDSDNDGPRPPPGPPGPPRNPGLGSNNDPPPGSNDDRLLRALEQLIKPGPTSVTTAPVHLNKPLTYDGKDLSKFRAWWMKIEAYLDFYADSFREDLHKINWVGSLLTEKAQLWHQQRVTAIKNSKYTDKRGVTFVRVDDWLSYTQALYERFSDPSESHRNAKKMAELKYKGDVEQYITELLDLNEVVRWSGTTFQNHIAKTLPDDITKLVYSRQGGVPNSDDEFIDAIRSAGRIYENMLTNPGISSVKGEPTSTTERSKSGQHDRDRKSSAPGQNRSSKEKGRSKNTDGNKPDDKTKRWQSAKEALKGIDQADIEQRKKDKKACWRCGRNNHQTLECYAKRDANGKDIPSTEEKVSAAKRPRKEESEEAPPPKKKAKIDAVLRDTEQRIFELSDSDSDF
ncbi:hypothetical protein F5B19DRAFT_498831 [Rostrohypoxylon terebratum]|nr:hypothetical protein F5B19DRAFT_498831 [Rostrohypoxylon terebratum]